MALTNRRHSLLSTRTIRLLSGLALIAAPHLAASAQEATPMTSAADTPYVLHVTAREVILEVVAWDKDKKPVTDLQASDFKLYDSARAFPSRLRKITSFRLIDPAVDKVAATPPGSSQVTLSGGCAIATAPHYLLAYQPGQGGWATGNHDVLLLTDRPGVELTFKHHYFVGETHAPDKPRIQPGPRAEGSLQRAACYRSDTPASINLSAQLVDGPDPNKLRYSLNVRPDALVFASITDKTRDVHLDYGACAFDASGKAVSYSHTAVDRTLTEQEFDNVLSTGFPIFFDLPETGDPSAMRIVVRDRQTGNIGSVDVSTSLAAAPRRGYRSAAHAVPDKSFGTILPAKDAICGDVYEISEDTHSLPEGFWDLDSVGSIYTYALDENYKVLTDGIPGITTRNEWFAIDFHGEFYLSKPGQYHFRMTSDDGAQLYIDDQLIINQDSLHWAQMADSPVNLKAGRHTLHVPYFQGPIHVTLIIEIQEPGGQFKLFDIRNYPFPPEKGTAAPAKPAAATKPTPVPVTRPPANHK